MSELTIDSGEFEANYKSDDWNLFDGQGGRENSYEIPFNVTFAEPPKMHVAPIGFDVLNDDNTRFSITVTDIQKDKFTVKYKTWCATRIHYIKINWLAYGQA